jgi:outer membrane protein assembly factor BamD
MLNHLKYMLLLLSLLTVACSEKALNQDNPQESFANARRSYDSHNYEDAIKKLSEFKSRFPYSRYATEAELLIADSYFETGKFTEAGVAYEQFVKLHPKHEKLDFALFRVGLCYWKDAPSEYDREQEYTQISINKWERLLKEFPSSPHSAEAQEFMKIGYLRISKSEDFIARFYCRKEIWHSCAYHSLIILERFPEQKDMVKAAIQRAAMALEKIANEVPYAKEINLFNRDHTKEELMMRAEKLREQLR